MDSLCLLADHDLSASIPCCRCGRTGGSWDRIGGQAYCPDCEEAILLGELAPVRLPPLAAPCAACNCNGTVRYLTLPLHARRALAIDLCTSHLSALIGRRLDPPAFRQLCRQLEQVGLTANEVFLLHDAFYDRLGRALQPIADVS